ncbi:MarR family transcriptional regulator [Saccharopolyspora cebuensis]|uniref:MarR family winged helix-turn-helix transcriptional regulator n=1 Tax=Saccharopolyspora cebuensis TaxID=418759 RepID=A0ABV4CQR6_9PSEU
MADAEPLSVAGAVADALSRLGRATGRLGAAADRVTYLLLAILEREGPLRTGALAEATHADPSTISRQVARLVDDGLVRRTADPADARATLLGITEAGQEHLDASRSRRNRALAMLLAEWDPADREALRDLLGRFVEDFERRLPEVRAQLDAD